MSPANDNQQHWALTWSARFILFGIIGYAIVVAFSADQQSMLWNIAYDITRISLGAFGTSIPEADMPVFATTVLIAGWSVSVDANLWLLATLPFLPKRYWAPVIILITLTHTFAGYLGLGVMAVGLSMAASVWLILGPTSWFGLRFIGGGLAEGEGDDAEDMARKVTLGLLSAAAFLLYWAVSYDEFFMVLQRFWWMVNQGWDYLVQAVLIGLSMASLLPFLLFAPLIHLAFPGLASWMEKHGAVVMFAVFSLIMYYLVRGIAQTGLGYEPWEVPYTGIAPDLLFAGFVLTGLYKLGFMNTTFESLATKVFLLDVNLWASIKLRRVVKDDEAEEATAAA